jgi:membrane-bound lytic murein transglycosylase B
MARRAVLAGLAAGLAGGRVEAATFEAWLEGFRAKALAAGVARPVIERAFADLVPRERVIELDRRQSTGRASFTAYRSRAISDARVRGGADRVEEHGPTLRRVRERFGVPPQVVVALWGIESGFGSFTGGFEVVPSLATLAFEGRRRELFERELLAALRILQRGDIGLAQMTGSWAGAMGQCQFMPSTYLAHAVDLDGDGRTDIWRSVPDVLGSIGGYLAAIGWNGRYLWGREVLTPAGLDPTAAGLDRRLTLPEWSRRGVRRRDGGALPAEPIEASLVRTDDGDGPSFLVYDNFRVLMVWNRSVNFALTVGLLADMIAAEAAA